MKTQHVVLGFFAAGLLACSGAEFAPGAGDEDTGSDASDSSATPDTTPDASLDATDSTTTPDATDSALPPDATDSAVSVDASDATSVDVAPDAVDTCVVNACGGCTTLTGTKGGACGECFGKLICDGSDALKCDGSTPKNLCGGCGTLIGVPGSACGTKCGAYVCSLDKSSDSCVDATPTLGDPCSTCGTVSYTCYAPGKTTCVTTDDRTKGVDSSTAGSAATTPNYFSNVNLVAFTYKTRRIGSIFQLNLAIVKQDWTGSGAAGSITVKIFKGVPGGSASLLATTTIDPALISVSTFTSVPAIFGTPTVDLPTGTALYFQFSSDQPRYRYFIQGGTTPPADVGFWVDTGSGGGYSGPATAFAPIFAVETLGCF